MTPLTPEEHAHLRSRGAAAHLLDAIDAIDTLIAENTRLREALTYYSEIRERYEVRVARAALATLLEAP